MSALPVIAIFDIGKTNKKLFLFNENYEIVFERSARFTDTADEDGFPCENLANLRLWVFDSLQEIFGRKDLQIKAINFSAYGASLVYLGDDGKPVAPLYNYLKPYPADIKKKFYDTYGGEEEFSHRTASPVLGSLNSGMQLYRIKYQKPDLFKQIKWALHLPQYISNLLTGKVCADITSIGCHTSLWDFQRNDYHEWVYKEGIAEKLPPIENGNTVYCSAFENNFEVGTGLHDSSAALIPYLVNFHEPFILISTGTWCISMNPFNQHPLTASELECDCLAYLTDKGTPVKASRLFAGNEHDLQVKRISEYYGCDAGRYRSMAYNIFIADNLKEKKADNAKTGVKTLITTSLFATRQMADFKDDEEAYHRLISDIIVQQYASAQLVLEDTPVKRIFVDGGFSNNEIYMQMLAAAFPDLEVYAASMPQATAVGTALSIHHCWNTKLFPANLIKLKYYPASKTRA